MRRQPFGGWKRSAIGTTTKAGGPSYLLGLGEIAPQEGADAEVENGSLAGIDERVAGLFEAVRHELVRSDAAWLRRALAADAAAWQERYGQALDVTGLACERNILRYRPTPVIVRSVLGVETVDLVRVLAAGVLAGGDVELSVEAPLQAGLTAAAQAAGVRVEIEPEGVWSARLADLGTSNALGTRVRILAPRGVPEASVWEEATSLTIGSPDVALYTGAVTPCPHTELLPFLREQSIAITNHRFGTPLDLAAGVV